jgi:hypothetical protein
MPDAGLRSGDHLDHSLLDPATRVLDPLFV